MTSEVLIVGRDSDLFAEHLGPQFSGLRFRCAHNSAEALARCGTCEILIIRTDAIFSRARIADAAAEADFLIVLAPYNKENHHMIDATVLGAMKPEGVLINIARGGVLDEEALRRALNEGWIAGAGLDVFQKEPL